MVAGYCDCFKSSSFRTLSFRSFRTLSMSSSFERCVMCLADLNKVPRWEDEDTRSCLSCHEDGVAEWKCRVAMRKREEERRKRFPTGPLYTCCAVCDAYIARETWVDDVKPEKCAACLENARNYELYKKFCEEMREIRAVEEAAAPAIIEAMRHVMRHVFGKCDSTCAGCAAGL